MKTCDEFRELLPLDLTGDLDAAAAAAVRQHLESCTACQAERLELDAVLGRLESAPAPATPVVDLAAIYSSALDRQVRSARRWRRIAAAGAALAAGILLLAVLPRLEVRLGGNELVLRWGPAERPPSPTPIDPALLARLDRLEERLARPAATGAELAELQDLLLTLAADVDDRDRRRRDELDAAIRQIGFLDAATRERFRRTDETSAALYTLITTRSEGGRP